MHLWHWDNVVYFQCIVRRIRVVWIIRSWSSSTNSNNYQGCQWNQRNRLTSVWPLHSQEWSISKFSWSLTRNVTSHNMKNLAFHSLFKWIMIIYYQFSLHHLHISLLRVGRMYFLNLRVKGLVASALLKPPSRFFTFPCLSPFTYIQFSLHFLANSRESQGETFVIVFMLYLDFDHSSILTWLCRFER